MIKKDKENINCLKLPSRKLLHKNKKEFLTLERKIGTIRTNYCYSLTIKNSIYFLFFFFFDSNFRLKLHLYLIRTKHICIFCFFYFIQNNLVLLTFKYFTANTIYLFEILYDDMCIPFLPFEIRSQFFVYFSCNCM